MLHNARQEAPDINKTFVEQGVKAAKARIEKAERYKPEPKAAARANGHDAKTKAKLDAAAAELLAKINVIRAGELLKKPAPARRWLCDPWIPADEVTFVGGDGGIGKTTLLHQAACARALGTQWLGFDIAKGRTLILSCEDGKDELHWRLEQIAKQDSPHALRDTLEALFSIFIIDASRDLDPTLATYDEKKGIEPTTFYYALKAMIERDRIDLLVIDSLADVYAKEIERYAARSFIRLLRELGCTVVLLAHPSASGMKDGRGYSGSTHWNNSVRSRLTFEMPTTKEGNELADPDLRILKLAKNNRAPPGTKLILRWKDGRFISESVSAQSLESLHKTVEIENLFEQLLIQANAQGRRVSHNPGPTYAPKIFSEHSSSNGTSRQAFARAQQVLLDAGKIRVVEDGPASKRRTYLEAVQ